MSAEVIARLRHLLADVADYLRAEYWAHDCDCADTGQEAPCLLCRVQAEAGAPEAASALRDEASIEHFDRYIAGDRR